MNPRYFLLLVLVASVAAGATWLINGPKPFPPAVDGIACQSMEGQALHVHAQLQLFKNGQPVVVPAGIGIPGGCFYWLHTHTADGVIHVESPVVRDFTLGQFFEIWGQTPGERGVATKTFVKDEGDPDFHEVPGDWKTLVLKSHRIFAVGTGTFVPQPFTFPEGL